MRSLQQVLVGLVLIFCLNLGFAEGATNLATFHTTVDPERDATIWGEVTATAGNIIWRQIGLDEVGYAGPSIEVTSPQSMDIWYNTQNSTITWVAQQLSPGSKVMIRLYDHHFHPNRFIKTITHSTDADAGSFLWQGVSLPGSYSVDTYLKVVVTSLEQTHIHGENTGQFQILDSPQKVIDAGAQWWDAAAAGY